MANLRKSAIKAREKGRSFYVLRMEVQRQMTGWTNAELELLFLLSPHTVTWWKAHGTFRKLGAPS
jgi:hypothetical protein